MIPNNFEYSHLMKLSQLLLLPLLAGSALAQNNAAGLWTGEITLDKVSEVHFRQTTGATPTVAAAPFTMRVLLHLDAAGNVKLLKEAVIMKTPGASPVPVIVTQPNLIPNFVGIVERGGKMVGRRFSTASFPMAADTQALSRGIPNASTITGTITLSAASPVNPSRHKYHPDLASTGVEVTRALTLSIAAGESAADHKLLGTWAETITGLHKDAIHISGTAILVRVSTVAKLNNL
jgi:hypothetical protein